MAASARVVEPGQPVPKGGGVYRIGKPYEVAGRTYVPEENINYSAVGMASWYGDDFHGRYTANGEVFDMNSISAAHPTLPLPSYVRVTNLANNHSIIVRVNDRGPYTGGRLIDLSVKTAQLLGFHGQGLARVKVEYVGRAPLEGSDDRKLMATLRENSPAVIADPGRREQGLCTGLFRWPIDGEIFVCAGPDAAGSPVPAGRGRARSTRRSSRTRPNLPPRPARALPAMRCVRR